MRARAGNTIEIELLTVQGDEFFSSFELHHSNFKRLSPKFGQFGQPPEKRPKPLQSQFGQNSDHNSARNS